MLNKSEELLTKLGNLLTVKGVKGLTQWEYDFINGVSRYFRSRQGDWQRLTGRQKRTACKIIQKYEHLNREGSKKPNGDTLASKSVSVLAVGTHEQLPAQSIAREPQKINRA
ncbi:hypothetical protein ID850_14970 [Xenorhabdus sp. Flor]|uniref:hypothetical protein n=1 Tax=Xenorhabdus cabanillasii TaxID=351673 RepID=UPI0019CA3492|nr:hypothetical protein [Xenorhabdus sp. Flor]MBD2816030.1 hypothetical protein [Xenorhabdus sp. Flor]